MYGSAAVSFSRIPPAWALTLPRAGPVISVPCNYVNEAWRFGRYPRQLSSFRGGQLIFVPC